jgi:hypothetical protein
MDQVDDVRSEQHSEDSYSSDEEESDSDNSFISRDSTDSDADSFDESESDSDGGVHDSVAKMICRDGELVGNTAGKQRFADVINKYSKIVEMAYKESKAQRSTTPKGSSAKAPKSRTPKR